ncbi:MAG TPA: Ig-like domain-containing protein [Polyangiaceae bacterium]|jgi:hypothetical protein
MFPRWSWSVFFLSLLGVSALGGGCGSGGDKSVFTPPDSGIGDTGLAGDSGHTFGDGGGSITGLTITPSNPTLNVTAPGATQQFQALEGTTPVSPQWTVDVADIGTIDPTGLFTASGLIGGPTTVTATDGTLKASTVLSVHLALADNPGNVAPSTQTLLQAGGTADPTFKWLYPYDGTVFARGIGAPELQTAGNFDAALLQISFPGLDYQGFYGASSPGRITLSPQLWQTITLSAQGTDTVKVSITEISAGKVTGPITESWTIAQGNLRGTIYYNSYNSVIAGNTGAIMSLRPGQATPTVVVAGCRVCHAVSADGSTMVSANEPTNGTATDSVWDLKNAAAPGYQAPNRTWVFGALSPDGSKFMNYGAVADTNNPDAPWSPNVRGVGQSGDLPATLYDTATGAVIPSTGLSTAPHMMMPIFSADGKMIAFTHYDKDQGHSVAVMDFDNATNTFSNLRDVATLPAATYVGWAAITPDDQFVFFAGGTHVEYSTISDAAGNTSYPANMVDPTSNLYIAHIPSLTEVPADQLNGNTSAGTSYLPFPDDVDLNFEPTILPEAVGGYFWVVFTSRRNYGNLVNGDPYIGAAGAPSPRKKLWVAAIDIQNPEVPYTKAVDLTHPAFYLEGQELASGNMRGFWSLDPCEANGQSCLTGDECCSGFCRQTNGPDGGSIFACVPPSGCAQEGEKCATAADCCGAQAGTQCIAGYCATPAAQ